MAKNEKTSKQVGKLASDVLAGRVKPTTAQAKKLAASALTQRPDKSKPPAKKRS